MSTEEEHLVSSLQEVLNVIEQNHQREQKMIEHIDNRMKACDDNLRAELELVFARARQRRELIKADVSDAIHEIVGAKPQLKNVTPPPLPYDHDADPLNIHGKTH
jgi:hypothetical protein